MRKPRRTKSTKPLTRSVGVRELKSSLSAFLREVKEGATLIVTEHDAAIAELRPLSAAFNPANTVLQSWAESGTIQLPIRAKNPLGHSPLSLPDGTAVQLLDEDRRDER